MFNFGGLSKPRLFMIKQKSAIMKKFFYEAKGYFTSLGFENIENLTKIWCQSKFICYNNC